MLYTSGWNIRAGGVEREESQASQMMSRSQFEATVGQQGAGQSAGILNKTFQCLYFTAPIKLGLRIHCSATLVNTYKCLNAALGSQFQVL